MDRPEGFDKGLGIALQRLRFGDKFEAEILRDLLACDVSEEAAHVVLAHLRMRKLISDQRTIEAHLLKRSGRKAIGRERLKNELLARGAPENLLEELLPTGENELAMARAVLSERFGPEVDPGKGARFLAGRGFDEDIIRALIESDD